MDFSPLIEQLRTSWIRAEEFLLSAPELAIIGLTFLLASLVVLALVILRRALKLIGTARRAARSAKIRSATGRGTRIVIANGVSGRKRAVANFLRASADTYIKDYMFGGPFIIMTYPDRIQGEEQAKTVLNRTSADLILWSETPRGNRKGIVAFLSRPSREDEPFQPAQMFAMPGKKSNWTAPLSRASAYAAARQFRPALGRPQDFRSERLEPVVESLLEIIQEKPIADPNLMTQIKDDATAGAVQLAQSANEAWGVRAEEIARTTLAEIDRTASPNRWIHAKIAVGKALRLRAERQFDPVILREGLEHLQDAMEALRAEPRLKLAESAAQGIADAQRLLNGQRKFSITGGGI